MQQLPDYGVYLHGDMPITEKMFVRERLICLAKAKPGSIILDIGCGRGLVAIGFAATVPRCEVYAIDCWNQDEIVDNSSKWVLNNARLERIDERLFAKSGDARALPFSDNYFDIVVSNLVIHNLEPEGQLQSYSEMHRVLKPGGMVIYSDIDKREQVKRAWSEFLHLGFQGICAHHILQLVSDPPIYLRALVAYK